MKLKRLVNHIFEKNLRIIKIIKNIINNFCNSINFKLNLLVLSTLEIILVSNDSSLNSRKERSELGLNELNWACMISLNHGRAPHFFNGFLINCRNEL